MIVPLLPSCCSFSFVLGLGYSFVGFQHSPFDGCLAADCYFGVGTGEDEHMIFYSAILKLKWEFLLTLMQCVKCNTSRELMYNIVLTVNKTYKIIKNVDCLREVLVCWVTDTTGLNWDCSIYGKI